MTYGYPYSHKPSLVRRALRSRVLAIVFIVLAVALLVVGIWWDNQRTSAVTERLRATAVTSTSIAPSAADGPVSHLEDSQAPPSSAG